jgi:hypothetical protein
MEPFSQRTATAGFKANRKAKPADMSKQKQSQEEPPLVTIEPYITEDSFLGTTKEVPSLARLKLSRSITVDRRYIEAAKAIAEIHPGLTFDYLIESCLRRGLEHQLEQELFSTKRMGRYFSYSLVKKLELPIKIDLK